MTDTYIPHYESCNTCGTYMAPADIAMTHETGNENPRYFCTPACYLLWATEEYEVEAAEHTRNGEKSYNVPTEVV